MCVRVCVYVYVYLKVCFVEFQAPRVERHAFVRKNEAKAETLEHVPAIKIHSNLVGTPV